MFQVEVGGEISGHTHDRHRVWPIWGDLEVKHHIGQVDNIGEGRTNVRIAIQDKDAFVVIAEAKLGLRTDHPV